MKLVWTNRARTDLDSIMDFIAKDSPQNAITFIDKLINHSEMIIDNPKIGRIVPEFSSPHIREILHKNYRIVYRLIDEEIQVLTVFEGHRLFDMK